MKYQFLQKSLEELIKSSKLLRHSVLTEKLEPEVHMGEYGRIEFTMNIETKFSTSCIYHHSYFESSYKFSLTY